MRSCMRGGKYVPPCSDERGGWFSPGPSLFQELYVVFLRMILILPGRNILDRPGAKIFHGMSRKMQPRSQLLPSAPTVFGTPELFKNENALFFSISSRL